MEHLLEIASAFRLQGAPTEVKPHGDGLINDTFVVATSSERYILQKKNQKIFKNIPKMMENIDLVTNHIRQKAVERGQDPSRATLTLIKTLDDKLYHQDMDGEFWVMTLFIEDSVTYDKMDSTEMARKGGLGIGLFQNDLADFSTSLYPTIPGFHDIRFRFTQWDEALRKNAASRIKNLTREIEFIENRRAKMLAFWEKVENGDIPVRTTHNDTKISNFLFDTEGNVLCAIDLDTVMSSTSLNDFGDAIRSSANTGLEDDMNLDRVSLNRDIFRAYTEGYLEARTSTLTQSEKDNLAFSALYITYEQVLRFLMDYIDGDTYYRIAYPEHNLQRTWAQMRLLESMEQNQQWMEQVVKDLCK